MLIFVLFLIALGFSVIAQLVSYFSGPPTYIRKAALGLGIVAVTLLGSAGRLGMRDLRGFVDLMDAIYVLPRTVTPMQSDELREYLSQHAKHAVTVKANPTDGEAREYAGEIYGALNRAGWDTTITWSTSSNEPPIIPSEGVCIVAIGENSKPSDDPSVLLRDAFSVANLFGGEYCGGGVMAGVYKLFVVVGHRPVVVRSEPMLWPAKPQRSSSWWRW